MVGAILLVVLIVGISRIKKPACRDCNIILVSMDTLGSNHLPCYGYERNTAPNICKFAKENIHFTQSYSNAPWTLPSHFSIFTSLYPSHHGMITYSTSRSVNLNPSIPTLTEILKKEGYETLFVGYTNDAGLDLKRGLGRGFDELINYRSIDDWKKGYEKLIENNKKGKKTFLFLHTYMVHQPYLVDDHSVNGKKRLFADKSYSKLPLSKESLHTFSQSFYDYLMSDSVRYASSKITSPQKIQELLDRLKKTPDLKKAKDIFEESLPKEDRLTYFTDHYQDLIMNDPEAIDYAHDLYDELIFDLDANLATLFELVDKGGLGKNTIVILTSDHGEEFGEHGATTHPVDHLYNTTTSTPLIMHVPGVKNRKVDDMVQGIDVMPTTLDLLGIKTIFNIDGISLKGTIYQEKTPPTNQFLISQGSKDSIRDKKWKLYIDYYVGGANNGYELYDLSKDPDEKKNIADKNRRIVDYLFENLNRIIYKR
jgi:arylsulfatase A-like enzyme